MKEELTREEIKRFILFAKDKDTRKLAATLLEEMDKLKAWDGASDNAVIVDIYWSDKTNFALGHKRYTRELPKTRARIMAEEIASAKISNEKDLVDIIEQTINTHMKELKGEE